MRSSIRVCFLLAFLALLSKADVVVVTPANLGNWTVTESDASVVSSFVTGPGTAPRGTGSVQFQIGADGDQYIILRNDKDIAGTSVSALTQLSYSTYQQQYVSGQAVYLSLLLSNNDKLYFEPVYQTGGYSGDTVPNQCSGSPNCAALNQWQTWNALLGGWWGYNMSTNDNLYGSNGGPPVFTLAHYATDHPTVTIDAIRLLAGGGAGAWDNFRGNADDLTFATATGSKTFDFESAAVPEPTSLILLVGMLGCVGMLRSRMKC